MAIETNAKYISKQWDKQIKIMSDNLPDGLAEVGQRGTSILRRNTPVLSGRLRNSMSYTVANKVVAPFAFFKKMDILNRNRRKNRVYIGTNVIYGPSVEYLSKNGSKGFMYRSYKQLKPIADKVLGKYLKDVFK